MPFHFGMPVSQSTKVKLEQVQKKARTRKSNTGGGHWAHHACMNTTPTHLHEIQGRKCKKCFQLMNYIFSLFVVFIYLLFLCFCRFFCSFFSPLLPLREGGMGLVENTHQPHNLPWQDPHQQHSVHMHTITHQRANYRKVMSTSPYPSISITFRCPSNSNFNLSTVSAATTFPGRPFHALTTLWMKDLNSSLANSESPRPRQPVLSRPIFAENPPLTSRLFSFHLCWRSFLLKRTTPPLIVIIKKKAKQHMDFSEHETKSCTNLE